MVAHPGQIGAAAVLRPRIGESIAKSSWWVLSVVAVGSLLGGDVVVVVVVVVIKN